MALLSGPMMEELRDAIVSAYDPGEFQEAVRFALNKKLYFVKAIPDPNEYEHHVFQLIDWAERNGRAAELVQGLTKRRPHRADLLAISKKCGTVIQVSVQYAGAPVEGSATDATGLEALFSGHLPFINFRRWMEQMARIEGVVCMITLGGQSLGTGFLVGPGAVLTNHHVMRPVIANPARAAEVECVFDYKTLADGTPYRTPVPLHKDWNIDACPPTEAERKGQPGGPEPTADELDYALIRLADPDFGAKPWARTPGDGAPKRGWVWLRVPSPDDPNGPLFRSPMGALIVQHPAGWPLKMAFDTRAIDSDAGRWLNGNETRVRYATNTLNGSSGSPVFDLDWNLVALHHFGDQQYGHPPYNQGVPIGAIRARLERLGHVGTLGGQPPA